MKKIKWLTEEQVQRAAKRGRKAALLCSIKHWEQLSSADQEQLRNLDSNCVRSSHCALCTRYNFDVRHDAACKDCGLYCLRSTYKGHTAIAWYEVYHIFNNRWFFDASITHWKVWKRASRGLLRRIIKLYESEYGEYKR